MPASSHSHDGACGDFEDTDAPEARSVIGPLDDALCKVEDVLVDFAEGDVYIAGCLENIGSVVENSRYREGGPDPPRRRGPVRSARLAHGRCSGVG
jgi:hypothetical protein